MEHLENSEKVEKYLKGLLSATEKAAFDKELLTNAALKAEVDKTQLLHNLLSEKRLLDIKQLARQNYESENARHNFGKYALGAVLLLGITAASYMLLSERKGQETHTVPQTSEQSIKDDVTIPVENKSSSAEILPPKKAVSKQISEKVEISSEKSTISQIPTRSEILKDSSTPALKSNTINTPKHQEPAKTPIVQDPCHKVVLHADIQTYPACPYQEKGAVSVSHIGGGTAPYSIVVKNQADEVQHHLSQLEAGVYKVVLQDAHKCSTSFEHIEIKTKKCAKNYVFNPFAGEVWEIPVREHSGTLTIVDKAGNIYLSREIAAHAQETWDGSSLKGDLKTGYYLYHIKYADGTELSGAVTLLK